MEIASIYNEKFNLVLSATDRCQRPKKHYSEKSMARTSQIYWLKAILIIGSLMITSFFQLLYAQDLSSRQIALQSEQRQFSQDDGLAYVEALEFCLAQVGTPVKFNGYARATILGRLSQNFHTYSFDVQQKLSTAQISWGLYKKLWVTLSMDQKRAFTYDVLAIAYGDTAASQALGLSPTGSENNQPGYDEVRDNFCVSNPGICP